MLAARQATRVKVYVLSASVPLTGVTMGMLNCSTERWE